MMAQLPLRGVVKNKVLELFANAYRAGGAPLELDADAGQGEGAAAASRCSSGWLAGMWPASSAVEAALDLAPLFHDSVRRHGFHGLTAALSCRSGTLIRTSSPGVRPRLR
jgi:hypothetical protein